MKKILPILILCLFVSCNLAITPPQPETGETLINGLWSAYTIIADGMVFKTTLGVKGINCPVQIVLHDGYWYIWESGYGSEIIKNNA